MKGNLYRKGAVVVTLALVVWFAPAAASAAELAGAVTHTGGIQFLPNVGHEGAILTINGNGYTVTRAFGKHRTPALDLFDANGYLLPDGNYRWQLELVPGKADAERLQGSASQNGGRSPDAWRALSGSFAIRGGAIASPDQVEPQAERVTAGSAFGDGLAAVPRARADRTDSGDSDNAVAHGAVELRASSASVVAAPAAPGRVAEDADETAGVEGLASDRPALEADLSRKRPTSAEGSNGRPLRAAPNR